MLLKRAWDSMRWHMSAATSALLARPRCCRNVTACCPVKVYLKVCRCMILLPAVSRDRLLG
jgi:hypothetical protein